jgi:CheY-like chemotaxis protein/HPt (histidine-containing phosphotransfer) domain-containing protein
LADDNPVIQKATGVVLSKSGHDVTIVDNGREVLDALEQERFDLVLMDVQMPKMDGMEATRRIREGGSSGIDSQIPVVALTAYAMAGDRERMMNHGMDDYLSKPFQKKDLLEVIARAVDSGRRRNGRRANANPEDTGCARAGDDGASSNPAPGKMDCGAALERIGGDRELLSRMQELFVREIPDLEARLKQAGACSDWNEVHRVAHYLKSCSATTGAATCSELAARLESAAKEQRGRAAEDLTFRVLSELDRVREALLQDNPNGAA